MSNILLFIFVFLVTVLLSAGFLFTGFNLSLFILIVSLLLIVNSLFTLSWMLYAWEDPHDADKHKSPPSFNAPQYSFSILVPARHEEHVISDTIRSLHALKYPEHLKEVLVLIRSDDQKTLQNALETIALLNANNIRIVNFLSFPINKPHALNIGLNQSKNEVVAVFDAEDEPHPDILNIINTVMLNDKPDIIQSGVQLMNYKSRWFSMLGVLEYFFWFKSGLLFFSKVGNTTPLGGNTVFIKRDMLISVNGWDEKCLTEDADLGIRLSVKGAITKVIYDEAHTTREETPLSISAYIKQRTRWNQGFLQILLRGEWLKLPKLRQKVFAFYTLSSPFAQSAFILFTPILLYIAISQKLPILITILAILPLYLFLTQIIIQVIGSYEFTKLFSLKYTPMIPLLILLTFVPYQFILAYSALRAISRNIFKNQTWEKTSHANIHRKNITDFITIAEGSTA